jgi:hypothetical protein
LIFIYDFTFVSLLAEFEAKLADMEFEVADEFVDMEDRSVSHSPPPHGPAAALPLLELAPPSKGILRLPRPADWG